MLATQVTLYYDAGPSWWTVLISRVRSGGWHTRSHYNVSKASRRRLRALAVRYRDEMPLHPLPNGWYAEGHAFRDAIAYWREKEGI